MKCVANLCPAIAGVEFTVSRGGRSLRGLVLADTLQCSFGAREEPEDWLPTFLRFRDRIVARAAQRRRHDTAPIIVLRSTDF